MKVYLLQKETERQFHRTKEGTERQENDRKKLNEESQDSATTR